MDNRADSRLRRRRAVGLLEAPALLQAAEAVAAAQLVDLEVRLRRHAVSVALTRSRRRATRRRS